MKSARKHYVSPVPSFLQGLAGTPPPTQSRWNGIGRAALMARQIFALVLIVLIVPMGQSALLFAQEAPTQQQQYNGAPPPPPPPDQGGSQNQYGQQDQGAPQDQGGPPPDQGAPQGQPLSPEELGQLVAPIALYPDALVAQILAGSTYPTQVVEADRWVQSQGNVPPEQLAAAANQQNWDPSVKALVAFPSVLAQMDRNIQWTTDLGNAYYNQPDDVMTAVQSMRARAQAAGSLHNTPQQDVSDDGGNIVIAPANPEVVYVPVYNPWGVYGAPIGVYPGYYYGPPAGVYFGTGLAIGFGVGIGIGLWGHWGWGWHSWHPDWDHRAIYYGGNRYYTRSVTVYNRGFNRPGSPHGYPGSRGSYYNHGGNFNRGGNYNRGGGNFNRGGNYNRGGGNFNRGAQQNRAGGNFNRGAQQNRGGANFNRGAQQNRAGTYNRGAQQNRGGTQPRGNQNGNRGGAPAHAKSGGGHPSGGGHQGGGHAGGGGHQGGGHDGGGHH